MYTIRIITISFYLFLPQICYHTPCMAKFAVLYIDKNILLIKINIYILFKHTMCVYVYKHMHIHIQCYHLKNIIFKKEHIIKSKYKSEILY